MAVPAVQKGHEGMLNVMPMKVLFMFFPESLTAAAHQLSVPTIASCIQCNVRFSYNKSMAKKLVREQCVENL